MKAIQQTLCNTDYYYCQPINVSRFMIYRHYNKVSCPFYAPVVADGMCRLCHHESITHRKYYIYSNYARKIQRKFLNNKYKKFYKENVELFKRLNKTSLPYFVLAFKFKILYYRRWDSINLIAFLKKN